MLAKLVKSPLFWVFLLALFLRVFVLGKFPYGFHADEVRAGWQASLGKVIPLYYNTFGDFRPTGIFYTIIPSLFIFGKTEFAVRFPSALFGALSVFPLYFLALEISKKRNLSFIAGFFLAISPWHIAVSRATSEVILASFLTLWALYFFIKKRFFPTLVLAFISYLFYHSTRILTPIFLAATAIHFKADKKLILYGVGGVILLTLVFSLDPSARGRLSQVSILADTDIKYEISQAQDMVNNKFVIYTKRFITEYAKYFGADFLIGYGAKPYRYITPGVGILTYVEFALLILGVIAIIQKKFSPLPFYLLLLSPLPAALTTEDAPNLMRAFYMVPFIAIIASYGFATLGKYKKIALMILLLNFSFFAYMYLVRSYIHKPFLANADETAVANRNIGTKELVLKLDEIKDNYEKIIVTGYPDNIRPWYEFFVGEVPQNIILSDLKCPSDDSFVEDETKKLLTVDSWQCSPESKIKDGLPIKILEKILRPDGSEAFIFAARAKN